MQRIEVKNFGPLKDVAIDVANIVVMIGESASGKSTLAKLVYFFNRLKDEIFDSLRFMIDLNIPELELVDYISLRIETLYQENFGKKILEDSSVKVTYGKQIDGKISSPFTILFEKGKWTSQKENLKKVIDFNIEEIQKIKESNIKKDRRAVDFYEKELRTNINIFFADITDSIYIPAGRSFISSLNNNMQNSLMISLSETIKNPLKYIESGIINFKIMMDFIHLISDLKDGLKDKSYTFSDSASMILKGRYRNIDGKEFLEIEDSKLIPIESTSSGQQEVLRIIQEIKEEERRFRVIEEPEAHLFPSTQKLLVNEIVRVSNLTSDNNADEISSKILITTHSPYILTSFAILLLAYKVFETNNSKEAEVSAIVNPIYWINPDNFRAYALKEGEVQPIFNNGLIDQNFLDEVSEKLGTEFRSLMNIYAESFKHKAEW